MKDEREMNKKTCNFYCNLDLYFPLAERFISQQSCRDRNIQ